MATQEGTRAAIWARVSTTEQHASNQLDILRSWAQRRGLEVAAEFITEDSAWQSGSANGKGTEFDAARRELLAGAHLGTYSLVLVWALDRLSRRGMEDTLSVLRQLAERGCDIWSHEEPWLVTTAETRELLIGIFAWVAEQESKRRSARIKAGLARKKAQGGKVGGGHVGAKDKKPRRRSGYVSAWEGPEGDARRAALAERNRQRAQSRTDQGR